MNATTAQPFALSLALHLACGIALVAVLTRPIQEIASPTLPENPFSIVPSDQGPATTSDAQGADQTVRFPSLPKLPIFMPAPDSDNAAPAPQTTAIATATPITAAPPTAAPPVVVAKKSSEPVADSSALLAAKRATTDLEQKLTASELEKARLQNELKEVAQKIANVQDARNRDASELAQLKAAADESRNAATALDAQLRRLKDAQASKDADLVAANYHLRDLESQLADQTAAAQRDRELMAVASGSEMRDVIGSRNLHIIDVADVENGGVRKPFGRVFYTEGKSLIFYAYDLSNTKGRQTFYAWGHREGDPHTPRALGALHNDDPAQRRWVFRFSDTKVLAQIDSVYVTLEPNEKPGDKPRGKKLLNAFLGTPANHP